MGVKTSQLQIRVSEQEKDALRRLAEAANMTVSAYVLAQALPTRHRELGWLVEKLAGPGGRSAEALAELAAHLSRIGPDDFAEVLGTPPLEPLSPHVRNQVAAMVEQAAHVKSFPPPRWVDDVPSLGRPHFGWPLSSLRPHQIRLAPVPFKRRGLFFDPASPRATPTIHEASKSSTPREVPEPLRRLALLDQALATLELKVEFYLLGGAVLWMAFHARPPTAHVSALFRPPRLVADAVASLTQREGWPADWLPAAIQEHLVGGIRPDRYVESANLSVFVPPLEYVLALEVAALRLGVGACALDDLRYVLRALNVTSAGDALAITGRYFAERQIPQDARPILDGLLTGVSPVDLTRL
jgi:hypothetical protein